MITKNPLEKSKKDSSLLFKKKTIFQVIKKENERNKLINYSLLEMKKNKQNFSQKVMFFRLYVCLRDLQKNLSRNLI